ncbi:MAG: hypothetical protein HY909_20880 [Deltaproteobacteria bacterium]|nr:hypothetical protein [Deltaproteobacteria bacterium]
MSSRRWLCGAALALGCYTDPRAPQPFSFGDASVLGDATAPAVLSLGALDGVWAVDRGRETFGDDFVLRTSPRYQTMFTEREGAAYVVTRAGCVDGARVVLEGEWNTRTTLTVGLVRLELGPPEVARLVCQGMRPTGTFTLTGNYGAGRDPPMRPLQLTWQRSPRATEGRFLVGAHHGRCQAGDGCGVSENTIPSVLGSEAFGAELVEIDVRLTREGVALVYHDPTFNPRLTRGIYCHGDVEDYTLTQVRTFCHALYGEEIPTLDELLTAVVERSNLRALWLDIKVAPAVAPAAQAVRRAQALAMTRGRTVLFFLGLPDDDTIDAFTALPMDQRVPCLIEVNPRDTRPTGCTLWGPRWTRGPLPGGGTTAQMNNIQVMPWTIDDPQVLDVFLRGATPNGVLSDYPGLVWRRYEAVGRVPGGPAWP